MSKSHRAGIASGQLLYKDAYRLFPFSLAVIFIQHNFFLSYTQIMIWRMRFSQCMYSQFLNWDNITKEHRPLSDTSAGICTHLVLLWDSPFSPVDHLALFLRNGLLHRTGPRRTRQIFTVETSKLQLQNYKPKNTSAQHLTTIMTK